MKKILVTGGCGYIGSHTLVALIEQGYEVICLDNLSRSDESVLEGIAAITGVSVTNYKVDMRHIGALEDVFRANPDLGAVIHFAALKSVVESTEDPLPYYDNNINSLLNLLTCMLKYGVNRLIFSSSCSVYGNPVSLPVTEEAPLQQATSPYAHTKQVSEEMLRFVTAAHKDMQVTMLRYFNPAGAHPSGLIGEIPFQQLNFFLVPRIVETANGRRSELTVCGTDYATRDGSCIRDFIHIMDLAEAHVSAMRYLEGLGEGVGCCEVFNVGTGTGVTVLEAIRAFEEATGVQLRYSLAGRRPGDVVAVYANHDRASRVLGWYPRYSLKEIMQSAWLWERRRFPGGK